jgi:hypothetical protein
MRGVDQFKKEAAWQRELQENINKRKVARKEKTLTKKNKSVKNAWQKTREAQKGGHKNFGGKKSEMTAGLKVAMKPWGLLKQMGKEGDGVYFTVFVLSITADLATFVTGAIGSIPVAGWLFDFFASGGVFLIKVFFMTVIVTLYVLVGHYKNTHKAKRVIQRIAVTMGFDFMELIPVVAVLPFFIASFLINYGMVLYSRAMEAEEKRISEKRFVFKRDIRESFPPFS